ncbi:hypothetical protein C7U61_14495 [Rhizobium sp. JAB6]|nr:hypothetical protein C7U61_14495 [Rhizobium sp. JAB6]
MMGPFGPKERKNWKNNRKYLIPYFPIGILIIYIFEDAFFVDVLSFLFIFGLGLFPMVDLKEAFQKLSQKNWSGK